MSYAAQGEIAATATAIAQADRAEWGRVARDTTTLFGQVLIGLSAVVGFSAFFVRFGPRIYATYQGLKWHNPQFRLRMRQVARIEELRQRRPWPRLTVIAHSANGHNGHKPPAVKGAERHSVN
jgi:hypothetical protein